MIGLARDAKPVALPAYGTPTDNKTAFLMTNHISKPATRHKALLRDKGWSLRTAAPLLGVHFTHLHYVLQGRRKSRRLLAAIEELPSRTLPAKSRKS